MKISASNNNEYITQTSDTQARITPKRAFEMLREGNDRFTSASRIDRDLLDQVKRTAMGQFPFAVVVSCIDSRIPTEIIFDQGIGDIFNARIAGNFVNIDILGSLEFAARVVGSKVIVVMGHTECGAIMGACDDVKLGNLTPMLANLMPAVEGVTEISGDRNSKNRVFVQKVAELNVELTIKKIMSDSEILSEMYKAGEIDIIGAMYHVHSGIVKFMLE